MEASLKQRGSMPGTLFEHVHIFTDSTSELPEPWLLKVFEHELWLMFAPL